MGKVLKADLKMEKDGTQEMGAWPKIKLNQVAEIKHGFAFKSLFFSNNGEYILLTPGNFDESGGFRWLGEKQKYYSGNIPKEYILGKDDLLIAMTEQAPGLLGCPILVPESGKYLHNQRLGLVKLKTDHFSKLFLFHVFNSKVIRKSISKTSAGTKVKHTSPDKIGNIYIPLLPLEHQTVITEILSTWDTVINQTCRLITAKKNYKKSLMQQFLKGVKSPKDFKHEKWNVTPLVDLISPVSRPVPKPNQTYLAIGIRSHGKGTFHRIVEEPEKIEMDTLYRVERDDIIVNITFAWEGAIAIADEADEGGLVSHRFPCFRVKENADLSFLRQLILTKRFVWDLGLISPGGAGRNRVLNKTDFLKLKVFAPSKAAQQKIGEILSSADREIESLEEKLNALEKQKCGLMQKLLTGEVRVKT